MAHWRPLLQPYLARLTRREQQEHATRYIAGLLSSLTQKTTETIAYSFDQPRHGLQHFLGVSTWDWSGFLAELTRQADAALAEPDGIVTLNLFGFPKKGDASVGVERQAGSPSGGQENSQVAVYLGYVSRKGAAVVDVRLYLPQSWTRDRARRRQCGIPPRLGYLDQGQLATDLLGRLEGNLPHAWVTADASLGQLAELRQRLAAGGSRYLVAVPPTTLVRSLESSSADLKFVPVQELAGSLVPSAWSPNQSGPQPREVATLPTLTRVSRRAQRRETLVIVQRLGSPRPAAEYYLSNAPADLLADEWDQVANAALRTADYLRLAEKAAGLASYEVRTWVGWYHHQALALVAMWLLQREGSGQGWGAGQQPPGWPGPSAEPAAVAPP